MSENSENFANGISTHNLSHFPITEIKKYQNHTKFTQNLSVNFSVIFPFYSKNSYSITHKITPTNPKTTSKNSQTSHKSTVFSESNHFLIIMHSFSYQFLSNSTILDFKIIPFSVSWKPSFPSKFHIFSPSYHFSNSKIYRNFLPWHTFSIRFTHKKRIYKIATNQKQTDTY